MFRDRVDAGRQLVTSLEHVRGADGVVLGIPRGGVVTAAEVAGRLEMPLDVVVVRKIGAPGNEEFAVAAIDEDGEIVRNPTVRVSEDYLRRAAGEARVEIRRRLEAYRAGRRELDVRGRLAIVVDDGIATGLTALSAVRFVRRRGAARVVLAVPVLSSDAADMLAHEVDELVCVEIPREFLAVGQFYEYFPQTEDEEVKALLAGAAERVGTRPVGT